MRKFRVSGQHLTEVALCLALVSTTVLFMRLYFMRALQARYKAAGPDYLISVIRKEGAAKGQANLTNMPSQYDPYCVESNSVETRTSKTQGGFPDSSIEQTVTRAGDQRVDVPGNIN